MERFLCPFRFILRNRLLKNPRESVGKIALSHSSEAGVIC